MSSARHLSGATLIVAATVVGGGAGYIVTLLAGARLGEDYTPFSVFWAALYLVVGALAGVQHEVSRATRPVSPTSPRSTTPIARDFAVAAALVVAALTAATSPLWIGLLEDSGGWSLLLPLTLGVAGYVVVAVLGGVFYGLSLWRLIALMTSVDGVLRLLILAPLLFVTDNVGILAWGVVVPFAITPILLWLLARRRVVGAFTLDVGIRRLSWNVGRTVMGSAASGVLISGLPLFVTLSAAGQPAAVVSSVLLTITAARAPAIIAVMSLQSYLVVRFRQTPERLLPRVAVIAGVIIGGTLVLSAVAFVGTPWIFATIFPDMAMLPPLTVATIVASGGFIGVLCVTAAAALSRSLHFVSSLGWAVAAAATLLLLLLPAGFQERLCIALIVGPIAGLVVHVVGLLVSPNNTPADVDIEHR